MKPRFTLTDMDFISDTAKDLSELESHTNTTIDHHNGHDDHNDND